ncbi:MAG: nucleotide exchange factor GrpE [Cyanobacteria bacterium CRU_2_1]|nr:nucleotide exchange factor GrpE [Cyanobacteria bacterium CRU_2_1]
MEQEKAPDNQLKQDIENQDIDRHILKSTNNLEKEPTQIQSERANAGLEPKFTSILDKLEQLNVLFQEKIQEDSTKAVLFDRLYSQLTAYRDDFVYKHVIQRVLRDLLRLFDTLEDTLQETTLANLQREDLISRLQSFHAQILKTLEKQEVELIEHNDFMQFDEATQEAIDVRSVYSPEDDQKVLEVQRKGFKYRDSVLRSARVIVGRYEGQIVSETAADSSQQF